MKEFCSYKQGCEGRVRMKKSGVVLFVSVILFLTSQLGIAESAEEYAYDQTKDLVALVKDAARLVADEGEDAFKEFRISGSRWRHLDRYIFVVDADGNMLVHPNPDLEGTNQLKLEDVGGKVIVQGIIKVATGYNHGDEGWYHYQWPGPDGIFAAWKSTFSKSVKAPSGKTYIVSAGLYDMKMERAFVVDMVKSAIEEIEKSGDKAFQLLRDPRSKFIYKDAYVFVVGEDGTDLVHPSFPNLEGRNIMDVKDSEGKYLIKEIPRPLIH